jgi:hypothetical protein
MRPARSRTVFETTVDGKPVRSPDHYAADHCRARQEPARRVQPQAAPRAMRAWRSRKDGRFLYPLLEGPLWNAETKGNEEVDGKEVLRIHRIRRPEREVDRPLLALPARAEGRRGHRRLQHDRRHDRADHRARQRRRYRRQAPAPPEPRRARTASTTSPRSSASYKIEMTDANVGKAVRKVGYIDLMKIADPDNKEAGRRRRLLRHAVPHHRERRPGRSRQRAASSSATTTTCRSRPAARSDKADDNEFVLHRSRATS